MSEEAEEKWSLKRRATCSMCHHPLYNGTLRAELASVKAKLAIAKEALGYYHNNQINPCGCWDSSKCTALRALAEIEGEK